MKILALATLTLSLFAFACRAEESRAAAHGPPKVRKASVVIGRDGQDASWRCSTENPNIEYRDCVNASTREPNAKVRMG